MVLVGDRLFRKFCPVGGHTLRPSGLGACRRDITSASMGVVHQSGIASDKVDFPLLI